MNSQPAKAILLDVDGVLAPFGTNQHRDASGWAPDKWVLVNEQYDMWLNPEIGEALQKLAEATGSVLYWCTSWLALPEDLVTFADMLGIAPLTIPDPLNCGYRGPAGGHRGFKRQVATTLAGMHDRTNEC